jgi:hypothetical protein
VWSANRRAAAVLALAVAVAVGGCRTPPYGEADAAVADLAVVAPRDLAPHACTGPGVHQLVAVPLLDLTTIATDGPPREGETARVRVVVPVRAGCERLGPIELGGGAIVAHVWQAAQGCGQIVPTERLLDLPVAAQLQVVVFDAAPGGTRTLTITYLAAPPGTCTMHLLGDACERTCECAAGDPRTVCLAAGGGAARCVLPCSVDWQCADVGRSCDRSLFVCATTCDCPMSCEPDRTCGMCGCGLLPSLGGGGACVCDGDCPAGEICGGSGCFVPCSDRYDCAGPHCGGEGCAVCSDGTCAYTV